MVVHDRDAIRRRERAKTQERQALPLLLAFNHISLSSCSVHLLLPQTFIVLRSSGSRFILFSYITGQRAVSFHRNAVA